MNKKIFEIVFISSLIFLALISATAYAACEWWNPFTWKECGGEGITGMAIGSSCTESSQCGSGLWCNRYYSLTNPLVCCEYGKVCCQTTTNCKSGETCIQNVCYGPGEGTLSAGDNCIGSDGFQQYEKCGPGLVCNNNICCDASYGMTTQGMCCLSDSSCTVSGYRKCGPDYHCIAGEVTQTTTKKADGESCSLDSDCQTGICYAGICCGYGKACCSDSHCSYGYTCGSDNKCIQSTTTTTTTKKSDGEFCSSSSDCDSGNCKNGVCCYLGEECCYNYGDCPSGYDCNSNHYCVSSATTTTTTIAASVTDGDYCTSNSECISGWCRNYKDEPTSSYKGTCCSYGQICCNKNIMDDCSAYDLGFECGDNYYCVVDEGRNIGDICAYDSNCIGAGGKCDMSSGSYGHCVSTTTTTKKKAQETCSDDSECESGRCGASGVCCYSSTVCCYSNSDCDSQFECVNNLCVSKTSTTTTTTSTGLSIVTSVSPTNDAEGLKIKKLIEEDIYPYIYAKVNFLATVSFYIASRPLATPQDKNIKLVMTTAKGEASWDEATNTLTVPYASTYTEMGNYKKETMQINAIAHELTHYHYNGKAIQEGGDYTKVPLWFREGIAEYGAYLYYSKLSDQSGNPVNSVPLYREDRFGTYLEDKRYNYNETWMANGIDKISWTSMGQMDKSIEDYSHIYYGAAFSFVKYLIEKGSTSSGQDIDMINYMFLMGSKSKFNYYNPTSQAKTSFSTYSEKTIKTEWVKIFQKRYSVEKLDKEPTDIVYGISKFFKSLFALFRF